MNLLCSASIQTAQSPWVLCTDGGEMFVYFRFVYFARDKECTCGLFATTICAGSSRPSRRRSTAYPSLLCSKGRTNYDLAQENHHVSPSQHPRQLRRTLAATMHPTVPTATRAYSQSDRIINCMLQPTGLANQKAWYELTFSCLPSSRCRFEVSA